MIIWITTILEEIKVLKTVVAIEIFLSFGGNCVVHRYVALQEITDIYEVVTFVCTIENIEK